MGPALRVSAMAVALAVSVLVGLMHQEAHPATWTVTTTADVVSRFDGVLSLREAILWIRPGDIINFDVSLLGATIILHRGQLTIGRFKRTVIIAGPGASQLTIDGNRAGRVFDIAEGAVVAILGVTITGGFTATTGGGGILNSGALTITDSIVSNNIVDDSGGGILNSGVLALINSTVRDNIADFGAGIDNFGTLTLINSTISNNRASFSGGGGIATAGHGTLINSAITNNSSFDFGGGIYNNGILTLTNSTISGNTAGFGSGISNDGTLTLINSTISNNTATSDRSALGGAIANGNSETATLTHTLVAGNSAHSPATADCSGLLLSLGYNLVGEGTGCPSSGPGDQTVAPAAVFAAVLGPLQNNGGHTLTHALLPGSPAIDAGAPVCADASALPLVADQRGVPRPQDGNGDGTTTCDIGAVEDVFGAPIPAVIAVTSQCRTTEELESLPPRHWCEVPNSHMRDVEKKPWEYADFDANTGMSATYKSYQELLGLRAIMDSWSGGAYDTVNDRLLIFGGGDSGYGGNEIYAFDLHLLRWERLTDPTPFPNVVPQTVNPDGTPVARETFNGLEYIAEANRFFAAGGAPVASSCSAPETWTFDLNTNQWQLMLPTGDVPRLGCEDASIYDPLTGHVFYHTRTGFYAYHFAANHWTKVNMAVRGRGVTAALDTKRRLLVEVGAYPLRESTAVAYDLETPDLQVRQLQTVGPREIENAHFPGLVYDPVSDRIVGWSAGTDVYTLNLDTNVWTRVTPASTNVMVPTPPSMNGTFGRFRYSPNKNVFILVNSVDQNVYLYKLQ